MDFKTAVKFGGYGVAMLLEKTEYELQKAIVEKLDAEITVQGKVLSDAITSTLDAAIEGEMQKIAPCQNLLKAATERFQALRDARDEAQKRADHALPAHQSYAAEIAAILVQPKSYSTTMVEKGGKIS